MDPANNHRFYLEYLETSLTGEMQDLMRTEEIEFCDCLILVNFCISHYFESTLIPDWCDLDPKNWTLLIGVYLPILPGLGITISLRHFF